jgi:hypothetical protein
VSNVTVTAAPISHGPTRSYGAGAGHRYQAIATICNTVLSLPPRLAGMIPYRITENRSAVTPHSRSRISAVTHQASWPYADSSTSAVPVSALSAIGSATFPNEVISSNRRAIHPSTKSVADATQNARHAAIRQPGDASPDTTTRTANTGTSTIRTAVSMFAGLYSDTTRGAATGTGSSVMARPRPSRSARPSGPHPRKRSPGPGPGRPGAA